MKCIERNPDNRYSDFNDLKNELISLYNILFKEKYVVFEEDQSLTGSIGEVKRSHLVI